MATLDSIRTVTIKASTYGMSEAQAALLGVAGAQQKVTTTAEALAIATDTKDKKTLSAAKSVEALARRNDELYRTEQRLLEEARQLNIAYDQGLGGTRQYAIATASLDTRLKALVATTEGYTKAQLDAARATIKVREAEAMASQASAIANQRTIDTRLNVRGDFGGADRAADFAAAAEAADRLRARYDPLFAAQQRYEAAVREVDEAERANIVTANVAASARQREAVALEDATRRTERLAAAQKASAQTTLNRQTVVPDRGADIAAYGREMDDLRAKFVPLFAAEREHLALLEEIERAGKVGSITEVERAAAVSRSTHAYDEHVKRLKAEEAGTGLSRNQSQEFMHIGRALGDEFMATGSLTQGLQVEAFRIVEAFGEGKNGVAGTFKALGSTMAGLATGWVGLGVGMVALVATAAGAAVSFSNSQDRLARSLEGSGRAAGMTLAQLNAVAAAGAAAGGLSTREGQDLAAGYAHAGFGAELTQGLVASTRRYGQITGAGTEDAGKSLQEAFEDPSRGVGELNKQFGFLDARLQTTIDRYVAQGNIEAARTAEFEAYKKAQDAVTDQTWTFTKALNAAGNGLSNAFAGLGSDIMAFLGHGTDADRLENLRTQLATTAPNDTYNRSRIQAEMAPLEAAAAAASADAQTKQTEQLARELSLKVDGAVKAALPDIERDRALSDRLGLLGRGMNTPGMAGDLGVSEAQMRQAFGNTAVMAANADPTRRMLQDYELARASAEAFSLAERAAVEARRAEVAVLRESGDVSRAAMAAEIARNEVIAKANQDAKDRLGVAQDQSHLAGLLPVQRALEELRLKYEGYGGQYAKDSASRSELTDELKPVARDIHDAGETIAKALRDAAASIAESVAGGAGREEMGPFNPARFTGKAGVSDHERTGVEMLVQAGYSRAASVGFIGGLAGESGTALNPHAVNPTSGAYGIEQVLGPRKDALLATPNHDDFIVQMKFLIHELATNEAGAGAALRRATTMNGGLSANLLFERPSQKEIASSYNARQAYGDALGQDLAKSGHTGQTAYGLPPITVTRPANGSVPSASAPAGVAPIAATALGTDHQVYATERQTYLDNFAKNQISEGTAALKVQQDALDASNASFGKSSYVVAEAAEKAKLYADYTRAGLSPTDDARAAIDALAAAHGKLAEQAEKSAQAHQQVIGAMDDIRGGAKGFLDPLIQAGLHGTSVMAALHAGLESIGSKIAGKLEDSAIDGLFGKAGTSGGGLFSGLSGLFGGGSGGAASTSGMFDLGLAEGGWVSGPGTGTSDSIPAMLSTGEFVVHARAAAQHVDLLHSINSGRVPGFAEGGFVGSAPGSSGAGTGGGSGGGGDVHIHQYLDGARGDAHVMALARAGAEQVFARNKGQIPGLVRDHQQRS